jgi:hypothetical protein
MKNITNKAFLEKPTTTNIALVPFEIAGSTFGMRLIQSNRDNTVVSPRIKSIVLGSLLGDGSLDIPGTNKYLLFVLVQTFHNFEYVWFIYNELSGLCQSIPGIGTTVRRNNRHHYMRV